MVAYGFMQRLIFNYAERNGKRTYKTLDDVLLAIAQGIDFTNRGKKYRLFAYKVLRRFFRLYYSKTKQLKNLKVEEAKYLWQKIVDCIVDKILNSTERYITPKEIMEKINCSYATAIRIIDILERSELLRKVDEKYVFVGNTLGEPLRHISQKFYKCQFTTEESWNLKYYSPVLQVLVKQHCF